MRRRIYSDLSDMAETGLGAGVLGGSLTGAYYLDCAAGNKKFARARVEAEDRAKEARDRLSGSAKRIRLKERLTKNPEYAKNLRRSKVGLGIALGSGLGYYGLKEKEFSDRRVEAKLRELGYSDKEIQETALALE